MAFFGVTASHLSQSQSVQPLQFDAWESFAQRPFTPKVCHPSPTRPFSGAISTVFRPPFFAS